MLKTYVLDTNVLLSDPEAIFVFGENDIVIPMMAITEIDSKKSQQSELGYNARQISRTLDSYRSKGNLVEGIDLIPGTLKICTITSDIKKHLPFEYENLSNPDNVILATALSVKLDIEASGKNSEVILVTKDVNMRIKCDALKIKCEDYRADKVVSKGTELYTGVKVLFKDSEFINEFYKNGESELSEELIASQNIQANEFIVFKDIDAQQQSALGRWNLEEKKYKKLIAPEHVFGLKPKNKEQQFAIDIMFDDSVSLVSLTGRAGCGKTICAIAAGLQQVVEEKKFDKLIICKPTISIDQNLSIGYLPGTSDEKMTPWIKSYIDNIDFLIGSNKPGRGKDKDKKPGQRGQKVIENNDPYIEMLMAEKVIEVVSLDSIRGRSLNSAFVIFDEAQNLTQHVIKTLLTRISFNSKVVILGDVEQIDQCHLDKYSNGLTYAIEKLKSYPIAGHITMIKGERSPLATLCGNVL